LIENKALLIEKKYEDQEFIKLIRQVLTNSIELNTLYKEKIAEMGFNLDDLNTIADLANIPFIMTDSYKESAGMYDKLLKISVSSAGFDHWNVSSCTSGDPSIVGVSKNDHEFLYEMSKRCFLDFIPRKWERATVAVFSPSAKMLNRIVMRYTKIRPSRSYSGNYYTVTETLAPVKYLINFSLLRAIKAIILTRSLVGAFTINSRYVLKTLEQNMRKPEEERPYLAIGGSVQLIKVFIGLMREQQKSFNLGTDFDVVVGGGGWDGIKAQMKYDPIDKAQWVDDVIDAFGTDEKQIVDIFGFTESPIIFGSHWSKKHQDFIMHCPPYARIIVRDRKNLEPVKVGEYGLLEVLTPFGTEASLNHAVLVDDLVHFISAEKCPECGYEGATFRVLGRIKNKEGLGCSSMITWL